MGEAEGVPDDDVGLGDWRRGLGGDPVGEGGVGAVGGARGLGDVLPGGVELVVFVCCGLGGWVSGGGFAREAGADGGASEERNCGDTWRRTYT